MAIQAIAVQAVILVLVVYQAIVVIQVFQDGLV